MMTIFDRLPECLLADVLIEWIGMKDLVLFDSAVCNSENRTSFLDLISMDQFCIRNTERLSPTWLDIRNIKTESLVVSGSDFYFVLQNFLDCSKLRILHFDNIPNTFPKYAQRLLAFINMCGSLKELEFDKVAVLSHTLLDQINLNILGQLCTLTVVNDFHDLDDFFLKLSRLCHSIHSLTFVTKRDVSNSTICKVIKSLKNLSYFKYVLNSQSDLLFDLQNGIYLEINSLYSSMQANLVELVAICGEKLLSLNLINVEFEDSLLICLSQHCKNLTRFIQYSYSNSVEYDVFSMNKMLLNCPNITDLDVCVGQTWTDDQIVSLFTMNHNISYLSFSGEHINIESLCNVLNLVWRTLKIISFQYDCEDLVLEVEYFAKKHDMKVDILRRK